MMVRWIECLDGIFGGWMGECLRRLGGLSGVVLLRHQDDVIHAFLKNDMMLPCPVLVAAPLPFLPAPGVAAEVSLAFLAAGASAVGFSSSSEKDSQAASSLVTVSPRPPEAGD